jgi:hypothetical protein
MGASSTFTSRLRLAFAVAVGGTGVLTSTTAGASSRLPVLAASTSNADGIVLLALGGGVLLLGVIGFVIFSYSRKKRRPMQCADQREALAQAEKAVEYWQAARAHLEGVESARSTEGVASDDSSHASLVAKAVDGLSAAIKQRDQCQMELIRCMASGVPGLPVVASAPDQPQPFFIPGSNDTPSS